MNRERIYFQADSDDDGKPGHTVFRSYPNQRPHSRVFFRDEKGNPSKVRAQKYMTSLVRPVN